MGKPNHLVNQMDNQSLIIKFRSEVKYLHYLNNISELSWACKHAQHVLDLNLTDFLFSFKTLKSRITWDTHLSIFQQWKRFKSQVECSTGPKLQILCTINH